MLKLIRHTIAYFDNKRWLRTYAEATNRLADMGPTPGELDYRYQRAKEFGELLKATRAEMMTGWVKALNWAGVSLLILGVIIVCYWFMTVD